MPSYLSINEFPGDGVTTQHEFSFAGGYIDQAHVKATVYTGLGSATPITITPLMWVGPYILNLGVAAPVGGHTRIYRETPREEPLTDFADRARVREANLDLLARQAIFVAAEAFDAGAYAEVNDLLAQAGASAAAAQAARDLAQDYSVNAAAAAASALSQAIAAAASAAAAAAALTSRVARAGDVMDGHLEVPAGAAANQAPRASEVGRLAAANTFAATQTAVVTGVTGIAAASPDHQVEVRNDSTGAAAIRFHRTGLYAAFLGLDAANALAWGGGSAGSVSRRVYHEGNVVGAVGQAGGIPTGGLVETGSNANGRYARFADGTQICWFTKDLGTTSVGTGSLWQTAAAAQLWPVAFASAPVVHVTASAATGATCWAGSTIRDLAGVGVLRALSTVNSASCSVDVLAIGRWY